MRSSLNEKATADLFLQLEQSDGLLLRLVVAPDVSLHVGLEGETLAAHLAGVRQLPSVFPQVLLQVGGAEANQLALRARVEPLPQRLVLVPGGPFVETAHGVAFEFGALLFVSQISFLGSIGPF